MPETRSGAAGGAADIRGRGPRPAGEGTGAGTDSGAGIDRAQGVLARLDRLDVWAMPLLFVGIIGLGFLFTFYDVFDINVSFIQSCVALKPGCTPETALNTIRVPIALNLAGYVAGTLLLSPISDKIGRRNMLLVTMLLTGVGSLWNALAPDYTNFVLARIVTGMAVGADLDRQHLHRRGCAAAQPGQVDVGDLRQLRAGGPARDLAGPVSHHAVHAVATRPAHRPGGTGL